jgi:hypothetical protein
MQRALGPVNVFLDDLTVDDYACAAQRSSIVGQIVPPLRESLFLDEASFYVSLIESAYRTSKYVESGRSTLDVTIALATDLEPVSPLGGLPASGVTPPETRAPRRSPR